MCPYSCGNYILKQIILILLYKASTQPFFLNFPKFIRFETCQSVSYLSVSCTHGYSDLATSWQFRVDIHHQY